MTNIGVGKHRRVLLFSDYPDRYRVTADLALQAHVDVHGEKTTEIEAILVDTRSAPYDAIVLDLGNDAEVANRIRRAAPETPLLILAAAGQINEDRCKALGSASVLVKDPDAGIPMPHIAAQVLALANTPSFTVV